MQETASFNTSVIDNKYTVVKRLDVNEIAEKVVFLVKENDSSSLFVLKMFFLSETNDFLKEVQRNLALLSSPRLIKCTHYEKARENMPPVYINGMRFESYSYIVLPYCKNGTLLDLLINIQEKQ